MNKIGVLICNHNYGNYIIDALESCVNQTRKPDKVIIVDDGSTDSSKEIILDYLGETFKGKVVNGLKIYESFLNPLFIFISLDKAGGPSLARNIGIDLTIQNIDLYQILDADDKMYPKKLEVLENKINESQEIGVVYADYNIFNVNNDTLGREWKEPYSKQRLLEECIIHSGSMIRKEALEKVKDQYGYYDVNMRTCEDYDLWLRISNHFTISHLPESLTYVRVHNNNATYSVKNEIWQQNWNRIKLKLEGRL